MQNNVEIVRRFLELLPTNKGWDAYSDLVDPNAKFCAVTLPEVKTLKGYIEKQLEINSCIPDLKLNIDVIFGDQQKVFARVVAEGSHSGKPYQAKRKQTSIPPTNKRGHWTGCFFFCLQNNKIVCALKEWDMLNMWYQLGWPIKDLTLCAEKFAGMPIDQFRVGTQTQGFESLGMGTRPGQQSMGRQGEFTGQKSGERTGQQGMERQGEFVGQKQGERIGTGQQGMEQQGMGRQREFMGQKSGERTGQQGVGRQGEFMGQEQGEKIGTGQQRGTQNIHRAGKLGERDVMGGSQVVGDPGFMGQHAEQGLDVSGGRPVGTLGSHRPGERGGPDFNKMSTDKTQDVGDLDKKMGGLGLGEPYVRGDVNKSQQKQRSEIGHRPDIGGLSKDVGQAGYTGLESRGDVSGSGQKTKEKGQEKGQGTDTTRRGEQRTQIPGSQ